MKKKILYSILLIILIAGICVVLFVPTDIIKRSDNVNQTNILGQRTEKTDDSKTEENGEKKQSNEEEDSSTNNINTIKKELDDGVLYTVQDEEIKPDIVIGDNLFDTQVADMMLNSKNYVGKTIEIEGMFLQNSPYTFVGRYSSSNLCPYCSGGLSYMEYVWEGDKIELTEETSWIKIIGTFESGNDETSNYRDYYYIKALSIEVMNERGQDTVNN